MEIIQDAIQPPEWSKALPRPWYKGREAVQTTEPWFEVYRLDSGDYAIYEPGHFQEVISFLLIGKERALLWDTGMGFGNIKKVVEGLCSLPLVVVNSHSHFDHIGGDWQFPQVGVYDLPIALNRVRSGLSHEQVLSNLDASQIARPLPQGFSLETFFTKPANPYPVKEGQVFDLGNRSLEVLHTPGHSPDSIMLLDKENSILLTGDTFYPATMYTHLYPGQELTSNFAVYKKTMEDLANHHGDTKYLYCSHNEPVVSGSQLQAVAEAFNDIEKGTTSFDTDERGLKLHHFKGFKIVTAF